MSSNMKLAQQLLSLKYAKSNIVFSSQAVVPRRRGGKEQRWQAYCAPAQMLKLVSERFNLLLPSFLLLAISLIFGYFFLFRQETVWNCHTHISYMYLHIVPTFFDNISTIGLKSSSIIEQQETLKNPQSWAKNLRGKWRIFQTITFLVI